jgi:hypothetical protein
VFKAVSPLFCFTLALGIIKDRVADTLSSKNLEALTSKDLLFIGMAGLSIDFGCRIMIFVTLFIELMTHFMIFLEEPILL